MVTTGLRWRPMDRDFTSEVDPHEVNRKNKLQALSPIFYILCFEIKQHIHTHIHLSSVCLRRRTKHSVCHGAALRNLDTFLQNCQGTTPILSRQICQDMLYLHGKCQVHIQKKWIRTSTWTGSTYSSNSPHMAGVLARYLRGTAIPNAQCVSR